MIFGTFYVIIKYKEKEWIIMWRWQYDEYYSEMEKEFEKYENLDFEMKEVVSQHFKNGR